MSGRKNLNVADNELKEADAQNVDKEESLDSNKDKSNDAESKGATIEDAREVGNGESIDQAACVEGTINVEANGWGTSEKEEENSNWGASGNDDLGNWGQEAEGEKNSFDAVTNDNEDQWGTSETAYKKEDPSDKRDDYGTSRQSYENNSRSYRDHDGYDNERRFETRGGDRRDNYSKPYERRYDNNNSSYPPREEYPRKRFERSEGERDYGYNRDDKRPRYDADRSYDKRSEGYDRRSENYERRPDSYERRSDGYEKRSDNYERRSDGHERRPDNYERRFDRGYERRADRGYDDSYGRSHSSSDSRYPSRESRSYDYERNGRNEDRGNSYDPMRGEKGSYENSRSRRTIPTNVEPSKAIGIFGLSIHATEEDLREFLNEHLNEINDFKITIIHDRNTGRSRGFGFVYFQSLEDSMTAKERLSGKSIKGKEIRVDYSVSDVLRPNYH